MTLCYFRLGRWGFVTSLYGCGALLRHCLVLVLCWVVVFCCFSFRSRRFVALLVGHGVVFLQFLVMALCYVRQFIPWVGPWRYVTAGLGHGAWLRHLWRFVTSLFGPGCLLRHLRAVYFVKFTV